MKNFGLVIIGVLGIWAMSVMTSKDEVDAPHEFTGCSASRRAIEVRLKAPGSAEWIDCRSTTKNGVQTVITTVDAQNSFGALLRSRWVTTVRDGRVETVTQRR